LATTVSGTPAIATEPVKLPPLWQLDFAQVVSPGALVFPVGGLLGLRIEEVETIHAVRQIRAKIENLVFIRNRFKVKRRSAKISTSPNNKLPEEVRHFAKIYQSIVILNQSCCHWHQNARYRRF
jgi:hypothetical protein